MLDARRLRLLVELERRGTIAAVADALAYTASAVSQQLSTLEREAGAQLLERVGRGVVLTDAGRLLAGHGARVLEALERAEADLESVSDEVAGSVRLASFQTVGVALLPHVFSALHGRHPALTVDYLEAEAEESLPAVVAGEIDLAIAEEYEHARRPHDPHHDRQPLCVDPLMVALPEDHPLAGSASVRLADLADERWASTRDDTVYADMLVRACRTIGGFEPRIRHRANDVVLLARLVAAGAVAILPGLGEPRALVGIVLRPVAERPLEREIFTVARVGGAERPSIKAVRVALDEAAAELGLVSR